MKNSNLMLNTEHAANLHAVNQTISPQSEIKPLCISTIFFIAHQYCINQAVLFLNKEFEDKNYLEEVACYNTGYKRNKMQRFNKNQGMVGASFSTRKKIIINDLPISYLETSKNHDLENHFQLVLIPMMYLDRAIGVLEFAIDKPLSQEKIKEIERLCVSLTSDLMQLKN
jgi:hypothetical protein